MNFSSLPPDKQMKLQFCLDVIQQCKASILTNQIWCKLHDISSKSYHYWLSKIRKVAPEELLRKKTVSMCAQINHETFYQNPHPGLRSFHFLIKAFPALLL